MFYIKFVIDFLFNRKLLGLMWLATLASLIVVIIFSQQIDKKVLSFKEQERENAYFYAMIPLSENISYVQRKVEQLPGVERVRVLSSQTVMTQVKKTLTSMGADLAVDDLGLSYGGIEVVLTVGLQDRSQELIRNYIKRIVESNDVLIGTVEQVKSKKNSLMTTLIFRHFSKLIGCFFLILYLFESFFLMTPLKHHAFLTETYQRKSNVFTKSMATLHAPLLLLTLILGLQELTLSLAPLSILLFLSVAFAIGQRRAVEC